MKPTAQGPRVTIRASHPHASRLLSNLAHEYTRREFPASIIAAMEKTAAKMRDWNGEGQEPTWLLTCDRTNMDGLAFHVGVLETRGEAEPGHIGELKTVCASMKRYLREHTTPPAPVVVDPATVDMDTDLSLIECSCPAKCKRCDIITVRRAVLGQEAAEADSEENVPSTAIPSPRKGKPARPAVALSPEPVMTLRNVPGYGPLDVHTVEDMTDVSACVSYLLTLSANHAQQHDPEGGAARMITNEITFTVNRLRVLGALRDQAGIEHVPQWTA